MVVSRTLGIWEGSRAIHPPYPPSANHVKLYRKNLQPGTPFQWTHTHTRRHTDPSTVTGTWNNQGASFMEWPAAFRYCLAWTTHCCLTCFFPQEHSGLSVRKQTRSGFHASSGLHSESSARPPLWKFSGNFRCTTKCPGPDRDQRPPPPSHPPPMVGHVWSGGSGLR